MTKTTTKYSSTATSDYAKSGNGYARISYLDLSGDNFLKQLKVTDISINALKFTDGILISFLNTTHYEHE